MSFNYGIDISKWQGEWRDPQATVDSGVDFVYMRAGNGYRKDTRVEEYAYIAKERGLNFGVYHFFRPKLDPVKQADFLYELHNKLGANMIPQLDIEHSDDLPADKVTHAVHLYLERARELFGVVSVYSAAWWWNPNILPGAIDMSDNLRWVARYVSMSSGPDSSVDTWRDWANKFNKPPRMPRDWGSWDMWQFSADGNHKGRDLGFSSSHLDLNILKPGVLDRLIIGTAAAPSPVVVDDVNVARGDRGSEVKEVQTLLKDNGIGSVGPTDGIFGPMTEAAVKRFQSSVNITPTGIVDRLTYEALVGNQDRGAHGSLAAAKAQVLRRGSKGEAVAILQSMLKGKGFYNAKVDGSFGPVTEQSVRRFQRSVDITVDGWVGRQTWSKL